MKFEKDCALVGRQQAMMQKRLREVDLSLVMNQLKAG